MSRILVVDDEKHVLDALTSVLKKSGHEVSAVLTGPHALASYATFKPDLVVLDLLMPGMDGFEVQRRLVEYDQKLPIVVLTGVTDPQTAERAMAEGATAYITKPINWDQVEATIETYLLMNEEPR